MAQNYFKTLRKSYVTSTLLTTIMSNLLIYGQPIQQMAAQMDHFEHIVPEKSESSEIEHITHKEKVSYTSPESHTFYAEEKQGVIGKTIASDRENPRDNFFTVEIPDSIQLKNYQAKISYDLYGLAQASQTTKSINNTSSYGGMLLAKNKSWNEVSEYISIADLKAGNNELYFTRRADENYQYKIKNFRLELLKKEKEVVLSEPVLSNFNGNVYLSGSISNPSIKQLKIGEKLISVNNGLFEGVLENISIETKQLEITYTTGNQEHSLLANVSFQDTQAKIMAHSSINASKNNRSFSYATLEKKSQHFEALRIDLPKGFKNKKLRLKGEVSINGLNFKDLKSVSDEIENVTDGDFLGYRLKKNNIDDSIPLLLHLKYDPAKIPSGYTAKDVKTFYFDHQHKNWKALPTDSLDFKHNTIISTVTKETDYINGIIKVPENPETSSFVPTAMNDIEFADPAAGVVSIAPPSANNMGTVNTSFPIKLPKGRNGMQPSLSVSYNSEAGNGWLGMGWNLNVPAITLNTKWGVPTFDGAYESELYSLNGEDLVLKNNGTYTNPHRTDNISRVSNRTFYLRKEGSYLKITRKGSGTSDYIWIVEDKFGNKSYYGGDTDNGVVNNYVIKDEGGNIVHWALFKQEDRYGNFVQYHYKKEPKTVDSISGTEFYLSRIDYTKNTNVNNNIEPYYTVRFNNEEDRTDAIASARNGTMQITSKLLSSIEISLHSDNNNELIRSYDLSYIHSKFGKSLLDKIEERDANGNLFYSNTIEYYDETVNSNIISSSSKDWQGQSDNISSLLSTIAPGAIDNVLTGSTLGTSDADGFSIGARIYAGIGYNPLSVNTTTGVAGNYSRSSQNTKITFIDINGDGLPDKVIKNSSGVKYRPNTGNGFGQLFPVTGIDKLGKTISSTTGWALDANALGLIGVGKSGSETNSNTDDYFIDYNGDGLPDMASGNRIRFNTTQSNADYKMRAFGTSTMQDSENQINSDDIDMNILQDIGLDDLDDLRAKHSQFDHVTVWKAPYAGKVLVSGSAHLIDSLNDCGNSNPDNQIRLTIEKGNGAEEIDATVSRTGYLSNVINAVSMSKNIYVQKDQYLFFRIHDMEYGCGGKVEWNPIVKYINTTSPNYLEANKFLNKYDENHKKLWSFNSKEDFILNNGGSWQSISDGNVQLNFNLNQAFQSHQFSDEIRFIIKKSKINTTEDDDGQQIQTTEEVHRWTRSYSPESGIITGDLTNTGFSSSISSTYNGGEKYYFNFYVESDSNIDWNNINWKPQIKEVATEDLNYPSVNYNLYNDNINQVKNWFIKPLTEPYINPNITDDGDNKFMRIEHTMFLEDYSDFLGVLGSNDDEAKIVKINWVIKSKTSTNTEVLYKRTFYLYRLNYNEPSIPDPNGNWDYNFAENGDYSGFMDPNNIDEQFYQFDLSKSKVEDLRNNSGKVYSAFYVDNERFGEENPAEIKLLLSTDENDENGDPYIFNGTENGEEVIELPFMTPSYNFYGLGYRGWGQFLYNGGLKTNYEFNDEEGYSITGYTHLNGPIHISADATPPEDEGEVGDIQDQVNQEVSNDVGGTDLDNTIYYMFYKQDNEHNLYVNSSIKDAIYGLEGTGSNISLTATIGRFGEKNLYKLYLSPSDLMSGSGNPNGDIFIGLKQNSKSKGSAKSGQFGFGSGTESKANTEILNQYVDLNGDRYPDFITKHNIKFSRITGGLGEITKVNDFTSGNKGEDRTVGVNISGLPPNSTESQTNPSSDNQTKTNINSGLNIGNGETFESRQWIDINGDGLPDKVKITKDGEINVQLNLGYKFSENWITWATGYGSDFHTSTRSNGSVGLGDGGANSSTFESGATVTASFGVGFGASESNANIQTDLTDVNGDGLPDLVRSSALNGEIIYIYSYNTGTSFSASSSTFFKGITIDHNRSISGKIYASYTYGVSVPLGFLPIAFKFGGTATGGGNASFSESIVSLGDINGDGYVDVLHKEDGNSSVKANLNQIGKTHLLKKVNTPLGGSWTVDYKRKGNTYDMPQSKWVMSKLSSNDGFTTDSIAGFGPNTALTTFAYEKGKYDRRDRSSYGFASVTTEQRYPSEPNNDPYRYTVKKYHNQNYYLQGMVKETASYKANGDLLSKSKNYYNMLKPESPLVESNVGLDEEYQQPGTGELDRTRLFPVIVKTISTNYENGNALNLVKEFEKYDNQGNLEKYVDWGTGGQDAYRTEIIYDDDSFSGLPTNIKVTDLSGNTTLREREATYYPGKGKLNTVTVHLGNGQTNRVQMEYDNTYGNTISITQLDNVGPDGPFKQEIVEYDPVVHTYPTEFEDSYNQTSSAQYNYLFGIPVLTEDMNGKKMRTRIDNRGRVIEVTAPNEMEAGAWNDWTIRNIYQGEEQIISQLDNAGTETYLIDYAAGSFPAIPAGNSQPTNSQHYAITKHAVMDAYNDELLTISIADGFGKAVQLKKSHYTNGGMVWLVGGYEKKDPFGRVVKSYLSANQGGYTTLSTSKTYYAPNLSNFLPPVEMVYDEKDRKTKITQPNESESTNITYEIDNNRLLTTVENENNQTNTTYTDVRGRKTKTIQNGEITTNFYYNRINELIRVKNTQGYNTKYEYDKAGRRTREVHPDRGVTTFKYNKIGSVIEKKTSNLFQQGSLGPITYDYTYNRLTNINYPNRPENDVEYVYGTQAQPGTNGIGRLILQKDATGIQSFQYGNLGELTLNARAIAVAGRTSYWYISKWKYDSWNRVQKITYPDQEEVIYNYDPAGQLQSISSDIPGVNSDDIVADIAYNKYGERERIMYGNGTESIYQYDSRRRLDTLSQNFTNFQVQKQYKYDPLSNVTEIATLNNSSILPIGGELGGPTYHKYEYDNFNRLEQAEGFYIGPNDFTTSLFPLLRQNYTLGMEYDEAHNITQKLQTHQQGAVATLNGVLQQSEVMENTDYKLKYEDYASGSYSADGESYVQPHAPRTITQYPSNSNDPNDPRTKKQLVDYDANGNMTTIKEEITDPEEPIGYREITLKQNLWDEENRLNAVDLNPEAPENKPEVAAYTYDANGERIIKYLPGRFDAYYSAENAGSTARMDAIIYPSPLLTVKTLPLPEGVPPAQMARMTITQYTKHYYIGSERISSALGTLPSLGLLCEENSLGTTLIGEMNDKVEQAAVVIGKDFTSFEKQANLPSPFAYEYLGKCGKSHDYHKYDAYWYHPDHLGSSSYITNRDGNISQHMEYLPFGETLAEEHLNSYNSPYKFNAKELDDETGNYYYGARYYNPKWSIWLSVDPMAEQTPSWSPYVYTHNNPLRYTDPTGMSAESPDWKKNGDGTWTAQAGDSAYSLAQDAGISYDEANNRVQNQLGDNYTNPKNGMEQSNVEIGDVVNLNSSHNTNIDSSNSLELNNTAVNPNASSGSDSPSLLDRADIGISSLSYSLGGASELINATANLGDDAILMGQVAQASRLAKGVGILSIALNGVEMESARQRGDKLAQSRAEAHMLANGCMTYGTVIGWGIGLGIEASLILNPNYENPRMKPNWVNMPQCFVKGTLISMADGSSKSIDSVEVGDKVKTYNFSLKKVENKKVLKIASPVHINFIEISFTQNITNINTFDHPYYVKNKGWCSFEPSLTKQNYGLNVGTLEKDDICYMLSNDGKKLKELKIRSIKKIAKEQVSYNLSKVDSNNNYFANGLLVHNKFNDKK